MRLTNALSACSPSTASPASSLASALYPWARDPLPPPDISVQALLEFGDIYSTDVQFSHLNSHG